MWLGDKKQINLQKWGVSNRSPIKVAPKHLPRISMESLIWVMKMQMWHVGNGTNKWVLMWQEGSGGWCVPPSDATLKKVKIVFYNVAWLDLTRLDSSGLNCSNWTHLPNKCKCRTPLMLKWNMYKTIEVNSYYHPYGSLLMPALGPDVHIKEEKGYKWEDGNL